MGLGGVFDNGVELFFRWEFVDAAIGDGEELVAFFADKTTREKWGSKRDVVFVGEKDVTRGIV